MKWLKFKMFWRTLFHKNQYKAVYELNQVAQPDFSNMKAYKGETK